ncbi:MAG: beta-lactamase [Candidatus Acidoferrum typicum]|nr:beta-lactamase [Candidatus Acidoferrum typicum]
MFTLKSSSVLRTGIALLLASCVCASLALGHGPDSKVPATKSQPAPKTAEKKVTPSSPELTATDLEAFLDGLMPVQLEHADIAGAVVAVVKDGKLLFAKGYGYSDYDKRVPVSPENTLFRPGSISKLFTWTSVMQLVEQGKLDLDRDVNTYIDFKVPATFGKPTTLRDIMTHRPGLEETIKDLFVGSEKDMRPIAQYLPAHLPHQIYPPGTIPAYSNYATTLAAYIVQRVSGEQFDDYVEAHVFKPLDMAHATFRQPLPDPLKPLMSTGYQLASGGAKTFEFVQVAPAGSLSASAESMTHFMIAHLQNGRYGSVQILKPETAVQMHQRQQGWPGSMNAMALGFYEESRNGRRIIGHGGDTEWFHSDLHLLLDDNVGFFVSYNSAGKDEVSPRGVLFDKFMDRYFAVPARNEPVLSTAAQDARSVAGPYEISRRFQTNVLSVLTVLGEAKVVADPKDNTIYIDQFFKDLNGQPKHFREVSPMLFRAVNGTEKLNFVKDANGHWLLYLDYPFMLFQQVDRTLDRKIFNYVVIGFSVGVIALTLLFWPVAAILRKHYAKPLTLSQSARRARTLVHVVCFTVVVFLIGLAFLLNDLEKPGGLGSAGDYKIHLLQFIGLLTGIGALIAIYSAAKSWGDPQQWRWYKIWNVLLAAACIGFFWFIYHWHLLNFNLNY